MPGAAAQPGRGRGDVTTLVGLAREQAEQRRPQALAAAAAGGYGTWGADPGAAAKRRLQEAAIWLETSDHTDPAKFIAWCCFDDFKARRLKPPILLAWLLLQLLGVLLQARLLHEISGSIAEYEATLAANCGPRHRDHDVCLDPSWNMSFSGTLDVPGTGAKEFWFDTRSMPATFLVGIEPLPPHENEYWDLRVERVHGSSCLQEATKPIAQQVRRDFDVFLHRGAKHLRDHAWACEPARASGRGQRYTVFVDHSPSSGHAAWTGSFSFQTALPAAQAHLYVVDARAQHLEDIHRQRRCSFVQAWQNFNARHSGTHHSILRGTQRGVVVSLCVSVLLTAVVLHRFYFYVDGGKLLRRIIFVKLVVQDLPQQVFMVTFMYSWFATDGLRCQMCLFSSTHCREDYALDWGHSVLCACTLLSASSNQLLLQARATGNRDIVDILFMWIARGMLFGVSVMPLSCALYLSVLWFHFTGFWTVFAVSFLGACPLVMALMTLLCGPFLLMLRTSWGRRAIEQVLGPV